MKTKSSLRDRIKKIAKLSFLGLLIIALALTVWALWPISVDTSEPDPAVVLANELTTSQGKYSEGYVGEEGSRIHYISAGQGEPIIFLHGFPSYWFTMFGLMEEFKAAHQVIAVDGLGVGKSDAPRAVDAYKLEKLVAHLDAVIAELGLDRPHLVGHDWGAAVSTAYAQAYPTKVKTVTLIGALPLNTLLTRIEKDAEHRELFSYADTFSKANPVLLKALGVQNNIWTDIYAPFLEQGFITEQQGERFRKDIGKPHRLNRFINWYRANFPDLENIQDEDFWPERATRLTVPAQFIYGENDQVVTKALVEDLKANTDTLKVIALPEVAHRPHYEEKAIVANAIRSLIAQH